MEQMTGTAVEKEICTECGAEIRAEAAFCYNCGGEVKPIDTSVASDDVSEAWLREDIKDESLQTEKPDEVDKPIVMPLEVIGDEVDEAVSYEETSVTEPKTKTRVKPKIKMKSAASLRKKPKSLERKTVEVVWEEREGNANVWFIAMSVLITLLVAGLFLLAMYLK